MANLQTAATLKTSRDAWEKIAKNLANRHMPPSGMPAPTEAERKTLVSYVRAATGANAPKPGRVTIRRLNRAEYNNTIRDLFGLDLHPADDFPSDDVGYGFDNIGDVLSMSPLLMENYLRAAQSVAEKVIYAPGTHIWHYSGANLDAENSIPTDDGARELYSNADLFARIRLPVEGDYKVTISAYQEKAGDADAKMAVKFNSVLLKIVDVSAVGTPQKYVVDFHAPAGDAFVGGGFVNDYFRDKTATTPVEDRNLFIRSIDIEGPFGSAIHVPPSQSRIIFVQPTPATRIQCERKILGSFAARAYRRPPTAAEIDKLVSIAELAHQNHDSFERGIQLGVTAALCSPNFLFRVEKPVTDSLSSYEVASRLSYFLWSSMPDEELFARAAKNDLQKPDVLASEVQRMLKDPKAAALAENFAGQWLQTRKLTLVQPDRRLFANFTEDARRSMATETKLFFTDVVQNDRSVLEFIAGRFSFVNGTLAKIYGIPGIAGTTFRRVELPSERAGILTQASVLTVTSNPTRTSPVKRGKWILENILGTPPPPPPPGVGVLKDDHASTDAASLRQRMEEHRKNPACAACHEQMDGLGFALENFDGVGSWRTKDGKFDIDASGKLPDGSSFTGPNELSALLLRKKDLFVRCLAEKMLTYSLGRGLESFDDATVDKIVRSVSDGEYKFSKLVTAVVESDAFRKNRTEK